MYIRNSGIKLGILWVYLLMFSGIFHAFRGILCLRYEAKKMGNFNLSSVAELIGTTEVDEQKEAVLRGIDELDAYTGLRPSQMFTIRLPFPLYLEFKRQTQRWQREAEAHDPSQKDRYSMTRFVTASVQNVVLPLLKARGPVDPSEER